MKTIALCMIVRNEAHVIRRCLESVRPLVDYVLVCDTGSDDGTPKIVERWLVAQGMPGWVSHHKWQDFAHNRSLALDELGDMMPRIDYAIMLDADDRLVFDDGFLVDAFKSNLTSEVYNLEIRLGGVRYHRPQLTTNHVPFCYHGVLHEFLVCDGYVPQTAKGLHIAAGIDGARSANPQKYQQDMLLLQNALAEETDPFMRSRYTFYLAQSYRDCGELALALSTYLQRADMGYWTEEVYIAFLNAARLRETLGLPSAEIVATYLRAYETLPHRAEALHGAARHCRIMGWYNQGAMFASHGLNLALPAEGLFIEPWVYGYGIGDEAAICAYHTGEYRVCLGICETLLEGCDDLPEGDRRRIAKNADYAREVLRAGEKAP